jgi:hypothetical protein
MKKELFEALEKGHEHWKENSEMYSGGQFEWFQAYCQGGSCALCIYFKHGRCSDENDRCPLIDVCYYGEWKNASNASLKGTLKQTHIDAVRDAIKKILDEAKKGKLEVE